MPTPARSDELNRDLARLSRHAAAADLANGLQPAQLAVFHRRGWMKLLAPRAAGGAEWSLPRIVQLEEAVAATDGSCGWVLTLCAGAGWFAGFLPPALARQVMATRRVALAGSGAPTGVADREPGGWRLNGRWAHASGAPAATHFTLNAVLRVRGEVLVDDHGAPCIQAFIVPAAQVSLVPGWFAMGMRATGSHAYDVTDAHVTGDHGFRIDPAAATASGPLYRFPFLALAWVTLSANLAGMARHFIALAEPLIRQRRPLGRTGTLGDDPFMRRRLAQAGSRLSSAWEAMQHDLGDAWGVVTAGQPLGNLREEVLQHAARALVCAARDAVDDLFPCCGLHAADTRTELHRVWRDFHTASQHGLLVPDATSPSA